MWIPVERLKPALKNVVKIVTFFTIAHSITLCLAAFQIISLPPRLIESIIAISIALAAIHNIYPLFSGKEWLIAFVFGLFHGFGFASVLAEKGLAGNYLGLSIFGFNLGVEIGQLAIILRGVSDFVSITQNISVSENTCVRLNNPDTLFAVLVYRTCL